MLMNESLFFSRERLRDRNRFELLSFHEVSLLLGLLAEKPIDDTPLSDEAIGKLYGKCKHELEELHAALRAYSLPADIGKLFVDASTFIEPMYYCASSAYWFDYLDLAPRMYELDRDFLLARGFDVPGCCKVIRALKERMQARMPVYLRDGQRRYRREHTAPSPLSQFIYDRSELHGISPEEFNSLTRYLSVQPGTGPTLTDPIAFHPIKARPALALSPDRLLVPIIPMLCEQLFESPYYLIAGDRDYFRQNANNRGRMAERILSEELARAAGTRVFRDVKLFSSDSEVDRLTR
jgi:hypothetical protein